MRRFRWQDPGEHGAPVVQEITEEELLATYYPYWQEQMRKVGREALINPESCIEDFVAVHWAEELVDG